MVDITEDEKQAAEIAAARRRTPGAVEGGIEQILFRSRYLLAPFYLMLVVTLGVLLLKAGQELVHFVAHAFTATEADIILGVLTMVDLTLTGSLIVIVIFSGYENFVSRIHVSDTRDWPEWMSQIDFAGLKLKLMSSIVAISAIQLLKAFMAVQSTSDRDFTWLVVVHITFVVTGLLLAWTDKIGGKQAH
jgi:uncharacterized protein (TIGR00645 family)